MPSLNKTARGRSGGPSKAPLIAQTGDRAIDLPERGPATANAALPARVRVDVDTLVTRPDLGANANTFVAAGDLVPIGLEDYTRTPAA